MTNNQLQETNNQLVKEKNVSDKVLNSIINLKSQDALQLPKEYSYANALKEAWLIISQDNKLMRCTAPAARLVNKIFPNVLTCIFILSP
jgi:recombination protein RecT